MEKLKRAGQIVFSVGLILFGLNMVYTSYQFAGHLKEVRSWPQVNATVTGKTERLEPNYMSEMLANVVIYDVVYTVGGVQYRKKIQTKQVGLLPTGRASLPLKYNPKRPSEISDGGESNTFAAGMLIAFACIAMGCAGLLVKWDEV